jgi:hypothetical protein
VEYRAESEGSMALGSVFVRWIPGVGIVVDIFVVWFEVNELVL